MAISEADRKAIGILGGMFDPVHFGHLRPMLEVKQALSLQSLRMVPCAIPPHRVTANVGAAQRVDMLHLAIEGEGGIVVDEREIQRETPSYSYDTLASLREEFTQAPLCLIVGMDAFKGLPAWYRWQELLSLCHLVVMTRPGSVLEGDGVLSSYVAQHQTHDVDDLHANRVGKIYFCEVTSLDISSTKIRACVHQGGDVRYLLPETVRAYIQEHKLYQV